jgi:hypothetical protein
MPPSGGIFVSAPEKANCFAFGRDSKADGDARSKLRAAMPGSAEVTEPAGRAIYRFFCGRATQK